MRCFDAGAAFTSEGRTGRAFLSLARSRADTSYGDSHSAGRPHPRAQNEQNTGVRSLSLSRALFCIFLCVIIETYASGKLTFKRGVIALRDSFYGAG